jgi:hypothetical protein
MAFIDDDPVIEGILGHLRLPATGPPTSPARLQAPVDASVWQDDVPERAAVAAVTDRLVQCLEFRVRGRSGRAGRAELC